VVRVDFSSPEAEVGEQALASLVSQAAGTEFDLENGPLHRSWLVRLGPSSHALVMYFHHLVSDGYSSSLVMREIVAGYDAALKGGTTPKSSAVPYSAYLRLKQARRPHAEQDLLYWRDVFATP